MVTVTSRGKEIGIPEQIGELTPELYGYFLLLTLSLHRGLFDVSYMRVRWMSKLLGMEKADYTVLRPEFVAEIESQMDALRGFFRDDDPDEPKIDTPLNLLPEYKGHKGPGDWLDGMKFGEFTECLTLLEQMPEMTPEESDAACRRVASVMYHLPEGTEPDVVLVLHCVTLVSSVWKALQSEPVEINGRLIDFGIIFRSSGRSAPDDRTGWTGVTFEVAAAGLFGNVRDVEKTDLWEVLLYLYRCRFEQLHSKASGNSF